MKGSPQQRRGYGYLRAQRGQAFAVDAFVKATGYKSASARTMLSEHWRAVVERVSPGKWRPKPRVQRVSFAEFLTLISQGKLETQRAPTLHVLLDACAVIPYYVPTATRSTKLTRRITAVIDGAKEKGSSIQLSIPNFCIAEVFSVFMKHGFSGWSKHVKTKLTKTQYLRAVERFQEDIHNGSVILQYELNRYHILGINLVAPVDHHYQMVRVKAQKGKKRRPQPAGTFDQLIISMGVQLARVYGAENTLILTADRRLAELAGKCRAGIAEGTKTKLGLDRCPEIVGLEFVPETFANVLDLQRAPRKEAEALLGMTLPV